MFVSPPLKVMLIDDRAQFPWFVLEPQQYECDLTGETYFVERGFRTDGASVPVALAAFPLVGPLLLMQYFGGGVFMGFREGVLHDRLRREDENGETLVPAHIAHKVFREALRKGGYSDALVENYYAAVKAFNS